MSSQLKTAVVVDDSLVFDGNTLDAVNHKNPLDDAQAQLREGQASVSSGDTHLKHLEDAITGASGKVKVTKQSSGADESLEIDLDATGITSGYTPTANGAGGWAWAASGGGGASPVDVTGTAGENLDLRDYVYLDESTATWFKVDTDATPVKCGRLRGMVHNAAILSAATGSIRLIGEVSGYSGLSAWQAVYASTTPGGITQTRPSPVSGGAQIAVTEIGMAISTTNIVILPPRAIQYMKRNNSLADAGTLTIEHHKDELGHTRRAFAYIGSSTAGATLTSYSDTNQDVDVNLDTTGGAGGTTAIAAGTSSSAYIGHTTDQEIAQGFQVTGGQLTQFKVHHTINFGTPVGNVTWEIHTDSGGVPSGTIIDTGTYTPTASVDNTINVTDGVILAAGTTYHLVLKPTSTQAGVNGWQVYNSATSIYANGTQSTDSGGGWSANPTNDLNIDITTSAATAKTKLAQSFQIGSTSDIGTIDLWLKKRNLPTGNLTLTIEPDSAGEPSGTPVTNGTSNTVAASTLSTAYGDISFTFAINPNLTLSTTYWLVLSISTAADGENFVRWGADASAPSYASGEMQSEQSSTWTAESKDAIFSITSPGTTFVEPASIGRWSGSGNDIAIRYDDGAASNSETNTTCRNDIGATADVTLVVEIP